MKLICEDKNKNTYTFIFANDLDFEIVSRVFNVKKEERMQVAFKEVKKRLKENIPTGLHPKELIHDVLLP